MIRGLVAGAALLLLAVALAAPAGADPGLVIGVDEDAFLSQPEESAAVARDLGVTAFRITLHWNGEARGLADADAATLDRVVHATAGLRMIVAVYGDRAVDAPQTDAQRDAFCSYAADVLRRYTTVRDIVVWNEANLSYFWRPQFAPDDSSAAPAAYEALLARCWDVMHAVRPDANVISDISSRGNDNPRAPSNISHSPETFIAGIGKAYRASGRTRPLFDTFGHHPYSQSNEPPSRAHPGSTQISEGDLDRLLGLLEAAFGGTGQRVPGFCTGLDCPTIWYLEAGYQTVPAADKAALYSGFENEPAAIPDGDGSSTTLDQGAQLRAGIDLALCQRAVGGFFNFLLADEQNLAGWQSGVLWADWTKKQSYDAFKQVIRSAAARPVGCAAVSGVGATAPAPEASAPTTTRPQSAPAARTASHRAASPAARSVLRQLVGLATRYAHLRLQLRWLNGLESYRSQRDARWALTDGFYRTPGHRGSFVLWLHRTDGAWSVVGAARDGAVGRRRAGVPCDVSRAFSRASCP